MTHGQSHDGAAFSLIELLVAIGVIAILALIALPNFLEAQIRAKTARAWSDMRALASALEAYHADNHGYPPDATCFNVDPLAFSFLMRLARLTTPIAYCATVPEDPFASLILGANPAYAQSYQVPFGHGPYVRPYTYDYAGKDRGGDPIDSDATWAMISRHPEQVRWAIKSVGPAGTALWLGEGAPPYDPTNGMRSRGQLYLTGPGLGPDGPVPGQ